MKKRSATRDRWRVLLAEDNDDHALLIQMALERASGLPVDVHRARNGEEAVALARDLEPDVILLDLKMPGPSGHEVLEAVKGHDTLRRIPVAVLTSSDRDEDLAQSYGLGGNHFITKPDNPAELEQRLRSLLKNLDELSSVRRSGGRLAATARSALGPATLAARQVVLWGALAVAVAFLMIFAYAMGVLG